VLVATNQTNAIKSLEEKKFFKLICGASFNDVLLIENLAFLFTLAGADVIDLASRADVILAASKEISKLRVEVNPLNKQVTQKYLKTLFGTPKKKKEPHRSVVTIWSDHHFGTNVKKEEVGDRNEFNWVIAARRLGMLCEQLATYKVEQRIVHDELVILLLGDIIGGVIHGQEGPQHDLLVYQSSGTLSYYTQALYYLKEFFPKIRVVCQPGNHGRAMHKSSSDRALQQKQDSYENIIYNALSNKFADDPKVFFEIDATPYSDVQIQGHRIFATHGDTVLDIGNVGKLVNTARIEAKINQINSQEIKKGEKAYEMFCTGHVHTPHIAEVGVGYPFLVNGCLIGLDPFALSVGIQANNPVQLVWETTQEHVLGDTRRIKVIAADKKKKYEKIIRPYKYELATPKTI